MAIFWRTFSLQEEEICDEQTFVLFLPSLGQRTLCHCLMVTVGHTSESSSCRRVSMASSSVNLAQKVSGLTLTFVCTKLFNVFKRRPVFSWVWQRQLKEWRDEGLVMCGGRRKKNVVLPMVTSGCSARKWSNVICTCEGLDLLILN